MRREAPTRRFLRANDKTGGYPQDVIFVDTETNPDPQDPTVQVLDFGFAEFWRGGVLRDEIVFEDPETFWAWVQSCAHAKRKLWVYAHNMSGFDFMVLASERIFREGGWETTATIVPRPFLYRVRRDGRTIAICDSINIYSQPGCQSIAELGGMLGIPKGQDPGGAAPRQERLSYCRTDVRILREAMFTWWRFCESNDLGYCAFTTAGQAMNAWRHRFMDRERPPIVDHRPRAAALERAAYCGGRTEPYHLGVFNAPVDGYDVNSMYPYVMRDRLYPTELVNILRHWNSGGLPHLRAQLDAGYGAIATVRVRTDAPLYPVKGERLIFPVGEFETTLCTESLRLALQRGDLVEITGDVAFYRMAPMFRGWVEEFYALRMRYRREGNGVFDKLVKLVMNALYGKFGQMTPVWGAWDPERDDPAIADAIEAMRSLDAPCIRLTTVDKRVINLREIGGRVEVESPRHEAYNAMAAVAAHVTDYARCWLWEFMETAGREHVLYVDTDSLYVDAVGSARLAPLVSDDLGALKLEKSAPSMTIHGPKDYVFGDTVKRKGVRASAVPVPGRPGSFRQDRFRGFLGAMRMGQLDRMVITPMVKTLKRCYLKGRPPPGGTGRTEPFVLAWGSGP